MKGKKIVPLILLAVIWGCYYVASQQAVARMSVFTVGVVIRFLTMILLTILMLGKKEGKSLFQVSHIWPRLLLIGLMGFLLDFTAFLGLSLSAAGSGTALLKCDILFVNLITVFIYKQKFSKWEWFSTFVMLAGVLMVMGIDFSHFRLADKGNIFFILSALFVSINAFLIKSVQRDPVNPGSNDVIAYYNNFVTMVLFLITAGIRGDLGQLSAFGRESGVTIALLCAGLGQTLIYIVYYYDLRNFPVWLVKVWLLFMPIVAAIVSFLLFGETMGVSKIIGVGVVLLGAMGILMEQRKKEDQTLKNQM